MFGVKPNLTTNFVEQCINLRLNITAKEYISQFSVFNDSNQITRIEMQTNQGGQLAVGISSFPANSDGSPGPVIQEKKFFFS